MNQTSIFFQKEKPKKKEEKGYAISTASEAAAVKVFYQNTTPKGVEILIKTRRA